MGDRVLIMNYESLSTGYLKCHILDVTWSPQRWLCNQDGIICPRYLRRLTHEMRCDNILGQDSGNIGEGVSWWFPTLISPNLSDRLGCESWLYLKSFMSLVLMKDYTCMVIDDAKVPKWVLKYSISYSVCGVAWHPTGWQLNLSIGLNRSLIN